MISLKIKAFQQGFFDRKAVLDVVDRATVRALSRFGAFVRTRARTSMRKRKKVSPPGTPPSVHTGLLKKFLFFAYDPERASVVIGPARLNSTIDPASLPALEYGGTAKVLAFSHGRTVEVPAKIKARPFMRPAFFAELPKADGLWAGSVS